jgi:uncharacterized membrane protein
MSVSQRREVSYLTMAMVFVQAAMILTIILDLIIARQVIGFFYLTFVPGYIILIILNLKLGITKMLLFAAGLSIAFLMGAGLAVNLLGSLVMSSKPLSFVPWVVISFAFVFLILKLRGSERVAISTSQRKLFLFGVVLSLLLLFCVVGTFLVNVPPHDNNAVLIAELISIVLLVGFVTFFRGRIPHETYVPILFVIALVLLFHVSLFSNYIVGGDIFGEYSSYRITKSNFYWDPTLSSKLYNMLSITILPTVYSNALGIDGTWIFKIVFPLIFAMVPIGLFELFKLRVSKEIAFFSAFFFVSNAVFFNEISELARQMVGELFYVLLFLTLFSDTVKDSTKLMLFVAFSFGLVVSHYAISYIFLASIFALWLLAFVRKRRSVASIGMVILFAAMNFAWYLYASSASTFDALINAVNNISTNFTTDFFSPQSRGTLVLQGVGVGGIGTLWHLIGRYIYYATEFLVVIGFLGLLIKRKRSFFNDDYNVLASFNVLLLIACIAIPNFAGTFNVTRFYHVSLFFLAPFCVLGGIGTLNLLSRKKIREKISIPLVILCILIPFFLFQTGIVYEISKEQSYSLPLSSYRIGSFNLASMGVLEQTEVYGAKWLSEYGNLSRNVYADANYIAAFVYEGLQNGAWLSFQATVPNESYVYLMGYNIYDATISDQYGPFAMFNVTEIKPSLAIAHVIYSSGSCEIFKVPPN